MRRCLEFTFDAAHYIPHYKGKCEHLHGHTYRLEVVVNELPGHPPLTFDAIREIVDTAVVDQLDHQSLNSYFENPTAERIMQWIVEQLKGKLPLASLRLWEGHGKWVELVFPDHD